MKKFFGVVILAFVLNSSMALAALRSSDSDRERLSDLVDRLEAVVERLEDESSASSKNDKWFCSLKTTSSTYYGAGPTKAIAKVKAIKDCQQDHKERTNLFCAEDRVKCEHTAV